MRRERRLPPLRGSRSGGGTAACPVRRTEGGIVARRCRAGDVVVHDLDHDELGLRIQCDRLFGLQHEIADRGVSLGEVRVLSLDPRVLGEDPQVKAVDSGIRAARPRVLSATSSYLTWSQTENQHERLVDRAKLVGLEAPGRATEALRVDDGRLLDEDSSLGSTELDNRPEARGERTCRSRCDEDRAQVEELVGLHHDRVTSAALLAPAHATRGRQSQHLAPDHSLAVGAWSEFGELLADHPHLLDIVGVVREATNFLGDGRATAAAGRGLA